MTSLTDVGSLPQVPAIHTVLFLIILGLAGPGASTRDAALVRLRSEFRAWDGLHRFGPGILRAPRGKHFSRELQFLLRLLLAAQSHEHLAAHESNVVIIRQEFLSGVKLD